MVVKLSEFLNTSFSTFSANDTNNTGVTYPGAVVHTTTLTPGVGIGAGIDFQVETADNNTETGMRLEAVTTDVTAGSEDFDLVVKLMQNGAAANEKFRVSSTGTISSTSANIGAAVIAANLAIGAPIQTDTRIFVNTSWTSDTSTYNVYLYGRDENTALTAIRNRYGIFSEVQNRSQNKNADGVTVYNSNYRAVVGDAVSGSSSSGGNAFASELIGGNFRSYNYANGSAANSVNAGIGSRNQYFNAGSGATTTATGTQHQVFSYGTGIITTAIGSSSYIGIGNSTVTGNITTAFGTYSQIESNTAATIGTGYLFYGQHTGTTTTNKFGVYITGEANNYFSNNVSIAGNASITGVVNAASHTTTGITANAIGIYPTSNSSGQNLGSNTARFQLTANAGNFTGMVTAGAGLYVQGILYANGGVSGSTGAVLLSGGGIGTVEWSTTLSANSTLVQALSVPISASGGFFTGSNMNASVHWAGANVYMNATSIFVSTNSTMNTIISANQITLNGANVMTTATTLKVFSAAGSQVFP